MDSTTAMVLSLQFMHIVQCRVITGVFENKVTEPEFHN